MTLNERANFADIIMDLVSLLTSNTRDDKVESVKSMTKHLNAFVINTKATALKK